MKRNWPGLGKGQLELLMRVFRTKEKKKKDLRNVKSTSHPSFS